MFRTSLSMFRTCHVSDGHIWDFKLRFYDEGLEEQDNRNSTLIFDYGEGKSLSLELQEESPIELYHFIVLFASENMNDL